MVLMGSALLMDAMVVLSLMVYAVFMVPTGSAIGSTAPRLLHLEDGVSSTASKSSARWMGALLQLLNVDFATSMGRMERAILIAAPQTQIKG